MHKQIILTDLTIAEEKQTLKEMLKQMLKQIFVFIPKEIQQQRRAHFGESSNSFSGTKNSFSLTLAWRGQIEGKNTTANVFSYI